MQTHFRIIFTLLQYNLTSFSTLSKILFTYEVISFSDAFCEEEKKASSNVHKMQDIRYK